MVSPGMVGGEVGVVRRRRWVWKKCVGKSGFTFF